ncbi:hypothetical protein JOQ06_007342 [Pogonophryne albipinna]|uniref:Uncharacterized protein n=1 Tax=Pogonophryne albipinna TaxID=1090488 RepID=A0AAD6B1H8_9TELE|nr:hypothetical protein JOQ06_007342 [Pogonophryne albipinna]
METVCDIRITPECFPISPRSLVHITYACCSHTGCHDLVCAFDSVNPKHSCSQGEDTGPAQPHHIKAGGMLIKLDSIKLKAVFG